MKKEELKTRFKDGKEKVKNFVEKHKTAIGYVGCIAFGASAMYLHLAREKDYEGSYCMDVRPTDEDDMFNGPDYPVVMDVKHYDDKGKFRDRDKMYLSEENAGHVIERLKDCISAEDGSETDDGDATTDC